MKVCGHCREEKPRSAFHRNRRAHDGLQSRCKPCNAQRQAEARYRIKRQVEAYLRDHPCVDCGETDPVVLQFDHVRGEKSATVAVMVREKRPWGTIEAEIAKCDVRCANCHLRRHWREEHAPIRAKWRRRMAADSRLPA